MEALPLELRARLDAEPARPIFEYACERLGLAPGHWTLQVEFRDGTLRQASRRHGPIGTEGLELLAARDAPEPA